MRTTLLIGQRRESYPGEYAPEVLEAADEYTMSDPDWMEERRKHHEDSNEFDRIAMITVMVPDEKVDAALYPERDDIDVEVVDE